MKRCAFLTLEKQGDFVIDDEHAIGPLADLGWEVSTISWRQETTPWSDFDAVIIRSTWDYWNDVRAFMGVLERIDRESRLANSIDIVRWNLQKTYLAGLEEQGVGIVPTLWVNDPDISMFRACHEQLGLEELVIKPQVGANGDDAFRIAAADSNDRLVQIGNRFMGRDAMIQPFMPAVVSEGEYSMFYFNGDFSHAILKVPARDEFRSQEERGAEVQSIEPEDRLFQAAANAMEALPGNPLYARLDFVRCGTGDFLVMEVELIEPSMYLRTNPDAPRRFAAAIEERFSV